VSSNSTEVEFERASISSFNSNGFTLGDYGGSNESSSYNYVSWNWKAASSNTTNNDGTIASTVRASQESGFSIVNWGATTTGSDTIGHGLLAKPQIIIMKNASSSSTNWFVYSDIFDGSYDFLYLNTEAAKADSSRNVPTATVFDQGNLGGVSAGNNCIAYCFANVDGYQRIGSFVGNGNANGPFVYTGFEPAWVLIKKVSSGSPTGGWVILDNKRNPANPRNSKINANSSAAENTNNAFSHNFYSNGFQVVTSDVDYNHSGKTYLFWAIAANPDATEPTKANSFKTVLYNGSGGSQTITGAGFKPDLAWIKSRSHSTSHELHDSVRGEPSRMSSDSSSAAATSLNGFVSLASDGFTVDGTGGGGEVNTNSRTYVAWLWKALDHDRNLPAVNNDGSISSIVSANTAAGFSIVKYKGNSSTGTVGHGLLAAPSIAIIKRINNTDNWQASISNITGTTGERVYLNLTQGISSDTARETAKPSTTVLSIGGVDCNAEDYIVYCWHSVSGYSSIGAYTGNGNATGPTITTGFEPSWVILKCSTPGTNTNWRIIDSARDTTNPRAAYLNADTNGQEETAYDQVNFLSNANGNSHIYMAFK
jgi:hypothetical protein